MSDNSKETEKNLRPILLAVLVGASFFFSALFLLSPEASSEKLSEEPVIKAPGVDIASEPAMEAPQKAVAEPQKKFKRLDFRISEGDTFYDKMSAIGLSGADIQTISLKAKPVYDVRNIKSGTILRVFTDEAGWDSIEYRFSDFETLLVKRNASAEGGIEAEKAELPHEHREEAVSGSIENSLYEDALKAGADPQAVMALSDIFAWDVDFASDIRKGDTFRILAEVLYVEGRPVRTGRILGAEMVNDGKKYTAVYFEGKDGKSGYFDAEGKSLSRTLLKSPLRFRRITSYFTKKRFHPILKKYRPHHGIDYGAPTGTPIESAGSGRVAFAGWKRGYGNFIEIRHSNGYTTAYGHLSKIGKGVKTGSKVDQGQVIGYVGSTGISTGPHLHYEVKLGGKLINPLSIKAVPDRSISKGEKDRFAALAGEVLGKLSASSTAVASNAP